MYCSGKTILHRTTTRPIFSVHKSLAILFYCILLALFYPIKSLICRKSLLSHNSHASSTRHLTTSLHTMFMHCHTFKSNHVYRLFILPSHSFILLPSSEHFSIVKHHLSFYTSHAVFIHHSSLTQTQNHVIHLHFTLSYLHI